MSQPTSSPLPLTEPMPYALPDRWQVGKVRGEFAWFLILMTVVVALASWGAVAALAAGNVLGGVIATTVAAFCLLGFGVVFDRPGGERGVPDMINAVVLSKAKIRPSDSWVHFFRQRGESRWTAVCFTLAGVLSTTSYVWLAVIAVAQGGGWWLFLLVPLALAGLLFLLVGVIAVVSIWRHASFGRRPIGLSLGAHGVIRYYYDGVEEFPWTAIAAVRPGVKAHDKQTGSFAPMLHIDTVDREDALVLDLSQFVAHGWLIYCAVRFWATKPGFRNELSTTFAQRRMERWRDAMLAAAAGG